MYSYENEKSKLFTDEGQKNFLKVRDSVNKLLEQSGAIRMEETFKFNNSGDSWSYLARIDRMVELGELREISEPNCAAQHRVFVKPCR